LGLIQFENIRIAVIGLGYVGLPLAVEFSKKFKTIGLDINEKRIGELLSGKDFTKEVEESSLKSVLALNEDRCGISFTADLNEIKNCNVYIVSVPTPTDKHNIPDLTPLKRASEAVGSVISKGDIVIYESTVYPGATEDECIPVVATKSGLVHNEDFYSGYSPERINPGDKEHTVVNIKKVTSGSTPEAGQFVDKLYRSIIIAGTHLAPTIKVAEAAKVIENSQRDINIAFVNELAKIFSLLEIDTHEVLEAAKTKWNFLPFTPGLVGGHCISIDPFYLAQKAQEVGYHPEIILAGRRINDSMGEYVATRVIKRMINRQLAIKHSNILILGVTFKEDCPDIRNSRVIDIYNELKTYGLRVDVYDPHADPIEVLHEYNIELLDEPSRNYSAIIYAVAHLEFLTLDISSFSDKDTVVFDVKGTLDKKDITDRL
jgi:UDP-N-acetyl-D-glucosamine/UDP-N-acetyl-D-galactosamine dehydrogenase